MEIGHPYRKVAGFKVHIQGEEKGVEQNFVDVWQGNMTLAAEMQPNLIAVLDPQEKEKAAAFKLPVMRDRYIAVRGLLRQTLASYLNVDPVSLQFVMGEHGKPGLACASLHFNLSHSGDTLVIAVANFADIGVDVEVMKPRSSLDSLAKRCFSEREFQAWLQLLPEQQIAAFYRLWTKKEAFVKAVGRGIALGLEQCEVEWQKDGQLLAIPDAYGAAANWLVTELSVVEHFCAALVTRDCQFTLRYARLDIVTE